MWAATAKSKKEIILTGVNTSAPKKPADKVIPAGTEITITKGKKEKYALWYAGIWDLPEEYVGDIVRIYSER